MKIECKLYYFSTSTSRGSFSDFNKDINIGILKSSHFCSSILYAKNHIATVGMIRYKQQYIDTLNYTYKFLKRLKREDVIKVLEQKINDFN